MRSFLLLSPYEETRLPNVLDELWFRKSPSGSLDSSHSLNLEQDEWSKALHQMASLSTGMVLGRADIDQKCCKVEEKARVVEEEVWHRQLKLCTISQSWWLRFNWRTGPAEGWQWQKLAREGGGKYSGEGS